MVVGVYCPCFKWENMHYCCKKKAPLIRYMTSVCLCDLVLNLKGPYVSGPYQWYWVIA